MRAQLSAWGVGSTIRRLLGIRLGRLHQYPPKVLSVLSNSRACDNNNLPRIALITPSFNQAKFIGRTIDSILAQAYPNLDYCIQDACSTDNSIDILHAYLDQPLTLCIERDAGQADALNRGFSRTSGEIMGYLNSDDLLLPGTLHLVGRYFQDHPDVDVIYGNRLIIDENDQEIGRWILPGHAPDVLRFIDYIPQESMFWRRRVWERVGAHFDASLQFAMDWHLILRFLEASAVFHHIPDLFGVFRAHDTQKSQANFVTDGAKEIRTLRLHYADKSLSHLHRLWLHGLYLYQHLKADISWNTKGKAIEKR